MSQDPPYHATYLIVGAGPAGLALACTLLNAGISPATIVHIEKHAVRRPREQSRAAAMHARTLEVIVESIDDPRTIPADAIATRAKSPGASEPDGDASIPEHIDCLSQVLIDNSRQVSTNALRHPGRTSPLLSVDFATLTGHTAFPYICALSQTVTEEAFEARLVTLCGRIYRPWELEGFEEIDDGGRKYYDARVKHGDTGKVVSIRATFVIGADGGHSIVRQTAKIDFQGDVYPGTYVLADFILKDPTWPWDRADLGYSGREFSIFLDPRGLLMFIPLPGARMRMAATVDAPTVTPADPQGGHTEDAIPPSAAEISALLDARGPAARPEMDSIKWASRFHIHHRVASAFRAGGVLLIGDAAHQHSPAGGQGMNTGIQDGVSLGRVLATMKAPQGEAGEADLEEWAARRRANAQSVVAETDNMMKMASIRNPAVGWLRDRVLQLAGVVPGVSQKLASQLAELGVQ